MTDLLIFDPKKETERIISFIKKTFAKQGIWNAVIGISGGIDSTTSLFLVAKTLPKKNIFPIHLYYFDSQRSEIEKLVKATDIPLKNLTFLSIKKTVDACAQELQVGKSERVRLGNIMARMRMIFLYDFAKKHNAMVCGTENKSEYYLAYFTRFGDEASDIEPIQHLFKTQVYTLARYLHVPDFVLTKKPSAGLWEGQTDEGQFGFSYKEADSVLFLHFEKHKTIGEITKEFKNAKKIIEWARKNSFKHHTPYKLN